MKNDEDQEISSVEEVYDKIAETYATDYWVSNPPQANLEFPGTTELVPDVEGKRILDAGCGSGVYTEWLLERGANVVAVDISEEMLVQARELVGDRAEFHRADLGEPLEFADDDEFDGIVSGSVFDHLEEWHQPFDEFARILEPGGFFVFSIRNPVRNALEYRDWNYFEVELRVENWGIPTPHYLRPFSEIVDPLRESGFGIDRISEPRPTAEYEEKTSTSEVYETFLREPLFLCLRVVKK